MINRIECDLAGRLAEEQRWKLLEIAQRRPVHRILVFEIDSRMCEQVTGRPALVFLWQHLIFLRNEVPSLQCGLIVVIIFLLAFG
jgi:hypothetical protein